MLRRVAQGQSEVTNAEPGQGALHAVHKPRAFLDQALALPIGPLGVLVYGRFRLDPNHDAVMRIGGEAPGGGPILSVGIGATSTTGSRHLGSSTGSPVVDASS